jgi:hypothetical protein
MEMPTYELEAGYNELLERISSIFASESGFNTSKKYIKGLLSPIERKMDGRWRKQ